MVKKFPPQSCIIIIQHKSTKDKNIYNVATTSVLIMTYQENAKLI